MSDPKSSSPAGRRCSAERHPLLLVEQFGDEALELGGILDLVFGLATDRPAQAVLLAEVLQVVAVGEAVVAQNGAVALELAHAAVGF
jgi:hypothetical protein